jgi:hypothetical protein
MLRNIGAILAGLVAWVVIATVLDRGIRLCWPEYDAAVPSIVFTLPMMFARLGEGAITTVAGGIINRLIARGSLWPAAVQGVVILLLFLPTHYKLWHNFPIWYHLTFLGYLIPLTVLGAALVPKRVARAST